MEKRKAIYPGSFDPVTNGHLDIIRRALSIFDEIIVVVARNTEKQALFSVEERMALIQKSIKGIRGVSVDSFEGLTVKYAREHGAKTIIRGLRAISDFDYEFQMALTNRRLSKQVETLFLMPSETHFYLSSKLVKELALLGSKIGDYVPSHVAKKVLQKLGGV